jgi:hypothetical protein
VVAIVAVFAAIVAIAVVFGTDVFFTVVGRPALARTSAPAMLEAMGRMHEVADRRMPVFGIIGLAGCALAVVLMPSARLATSIALAAQLLWLAIYAKINKPLNAKMIEAARAGSALPDARDARGWQKHWESALVPRSLLMGIALVALLLTVVLAR